MLFGDFHIVTVFSAPVVTSASARSHRESPFDGTSAPATLIRPGVSTCIGGVDAVAGGTVSVDSVTGVSVLRPHAASRRKAIRALFMPWMLPQSRQPSAHPPAPPAPAPPPPPTRR